MTTTTAVHVVAKDVRGVEKRVHITDGSKSSIDDVRHAVARAYGVHDHRARLYLVDGDDVELKGASSWIERCGTTSRVCVVGFARAKTSRRRRRVPTTATATASATREPDAFLCELREDVAQYATKTTTTTRAVDSTLGVDALERLVDVFAATARASLFLRRQRAQPTLRACASAMVKERAVTLEEARAMEMLCPGCIRLIARDAGEDVLVDASAPDDDGPSAFVVPKYLSRRAFAEETRDGVDRRASDAVAVHGWRRSMRSVEGHARATAETTARFGANFEKIVAAHRAAFERGLREAMERVPFDSRRDTPLAAYVDAVREIRERDAATENREASARASASGVAAPPETMDRPPAPPRRARATRKNTKRDAPENAVSHCTSDEPMNVDEFVAHLQEATRGEIAHVEHFAGKPASRAPLPSGVSVSDATLAAFASVGVDLRERLFSHQARAIEVMLDERSEEKHVVVSTGTASGKSLCYNAPVIETLLSDPSATALYIFPTKALAQDQVRAVRQILAGAPRREETVFDVGVYDGDASEDARATTRDECRLIVTNPDMLHVSVLPNHKRWTRVLRGLRYVVVDEAHAYSGVFGSHVALILRRLRRICFEEYGSSPRFVVSSATVANPAEHARDLIGYHGHDAPERDRIAVVTNDGAPRGEKTFVLWNPRLKPGTKTTNTNRKFRRVTAIERGKAALAKRLRDGKNDADENEAREDDAEDERTATEDGARASPVVDVSQLLAECVRHNLRCLAFCKTRKLCELVLVYAREILRATAPHLAEKVASYRGGYEAGERRVIEKELFSGSLLGVAATNALELGIDVGSLDVTLHLGFPGSVASLWQQAGRAGRRERRALSVYVAFDGPLDQHFMRQPRALFDAPLEMSYVWTKNPTILAQHMTCAAYERALFGIPGADQAYFGDSALDVAGTLVASGKLCRDVRSTTPWNPNARIVQPLLAPYERTPALDVSVRTIEEERFEVVDIGGARDKVIANIEASKAFFEVYEGAVYTHQGRTMLCTKLDLERGRALVRAADVKYFTRVKHETTCVVPGGVRAYSDTDGELPMRACVRCDDVTIRTVFTGFSRVARGSQAKFDHEAFPPRETTFRTVGAWLRIPDALVAEANAAGVDLRAGIHAASHAVLNALPLHVPCGDDDVGCECFSADLHAERGRRYAPLRFLLYDRHLGGVGIASRASELFPELIRDALDIINACECERIDGCPGCVQRKSCDAHNAHIRRDAARFILERVRTAFPPETRRDDDDRKNSNTRNDSARVE